MKKFLKVLFCILILFLILFCIKSFLNRERHILYIKNETNENFKNAQLIYYTGEIVNLGEIHPKEKIKHKMMTDIENHITLILYDKDGNKIEQVVVGYVFKGVCNVKVKIKKVQDKIEIISTG
ncbi:MAG: hypothetical protein K2F59_00725 [Eubacteriales bacterium]|nr:hypothetical protein [Eubacteriales bacterium]